MPINIRVPVPERESQAEGCTPLPLDAGSGEIPAINKESGQLPPSDMVSRFCFLSFCVNRGIWLLAAYGPVKTMWKQIKKN